ncbi:MAG: hypothetical protein A3I02_12800 [Betaproteobacteria bacterium RIFCSPLOWO2_02_FULL_67_26]|nr:MAG: hypothetical protein A3I02_12800 [Betaproteobacteria bacterium RIFCSPLOWO2_02_FULL_67_26]
MPETTPGEAGSGILRSLRNLAGTLVALLHTRLQLLVTEIEEERLRLLQLLFWAAAALLFFAMGLQLLVLLLVVLFWESYRVTAIVVLAGVFMALGIFMAIRVRNRSHARPRLLTTSLGELAKDKEQLTPR